MMIMCVNGQQDKVYIFNDDDESIWMQINQGATRWSFVFAEGFVNRLVGRASRGLDRRWPGEYRFL